LKLLYAANYTILTQINDAYYFCEFEKKKSNAHHNIAIVPSN
jgi:hypothetical protein